MYAPQTPTYFDPQSLPCFDPSALFVLETSHPARIHRKKAPTTQAPPSSAPTTPLNPSLSTSSKDCS
ncbi:hypothetical protein L6R29_15195 [Myxococcota bacterium]|nr:hypothetical protein [Myxococcota bacterium]